MSPALRSRADVATAADTAGVELVEHVLGSHLVRFGARDELTVTWQRS